MKDSNKNLVRSKLNFKEFIISQSFENINIQFVKQYIPKGREKPLGTSDAVVQALDQFPELKQNIFTVCNGDNLYSYYYLFTSQGTGRATYVENTYVSSCETSGNIKLEEL